MKKMRFEAPQKIGWSKAYKKAVRELDKEMEKWSKLNFSALLITLKRDYCYGITRLCNVLEEVLNACDECSGFSTEKSMIEMLYDETGVEIVCDSEKSWKDVSYINGKLWDGRIPSEPEMIAIRIAQKKWIKGMVNASILLAMHRLYGFGYERLAKLYANMEKVLDQYDNVKDIVDVCMEETNINIVRYFDEGVKDRNKRDWKGAKE